MRDINELNNDPIEKSSDQLDTPFLIDSQVLQIVQQPETLPIQPAANDSILNQDYFLDVTDYPAPEMMLQPTTQEMSQIVTPEPGDVFQLLPNLNDPGIIPANNEGKMLYQDPNIEQTPGDLPNQSLNLPPIDVVDAEPPTLDYFESFPNVTNDVDLKEAVILNVTSGQTGETVQVNTTAGDLPAVVAAAVVADQAIQTETTQTDQTATTTTETAAAVPDLLFGYDRTTVYAVGGLAAIALLIGFSYFGED